MTAPRTLLGAWQLHAKKSLGQNFLTNPSTADKIASAAGITRDDVVLEIGPGLGALTIPAARRAKRVIAVETDRELAKLLTTELRVAGVENVEILEADFLRFDLARAAVADGPLLVIGNLPYHISSQILIRLIRQRRAVRRAVLMFQKELADRLTAAPGKKTYGRISVMLQYCAVIAPLANLAPDQFFPRPRVDSTVIDIRFRDRPEVPADDEAVLFRVIQAAFGQRRKTLRNALSGGLPELDKAAAETALAATGIDPARRAETLSVAEFVRLANRLGALGIQDPEFT